MTAKQAAANLNAAQEAYNRNIIANAINEHVQANVGKQQLASNVLLNTTGIQQQAAVVAGQQGIANGSIRSLKQLNNVRKAAARAARDAASSGQALDEARDERELQRL